MNDGVMVLALCLVAELVVAVVILKRLVCFVGRPARRVHVGGIKHHAIDSSIGIGQIPTIDTLLDIGCSKIVFSRRHKPPKDPFAISHVCNNATGLHVKVEDSWKGMVIATHKGAGNKVVERNSIADNAFSATWRSLAYYHLALAIPSPFHV